MNSMDTCVAIGGMAASVGARYPSQSPPGKLPIKDIPAQSDSQTQHEPVQTKVSFSTYGSHNERVSVVVRNKETGEVIREIPSKEMQKLHTYLDMLI